MTDQEILKAAISKAGLLDWGNPRFDLDGKLVAPDYNVIFSIDFAKAFWQPKDTHRVVCAMCGVLRKKKIRFRVKGKWTEWIEWDDKKKTPSDFDALEIQEIITLAELKQLFPEEYKKLNL